MDRLFAGIYLKVAASVLLAGAVVSLLAVPRMLATIRANVTLAHTPAAILLADALGKAAARGEDLDRIIAKGTASGGMPTALVPLESVHPEDAARFDQGAPVIEGPGPGQLMLYVRIPGTARVLREGPLLKDSPIGEGRGLAVLLGAMAGLVFGVYVLLRPIRRRLGALAAAADRLGEGQVDSRADDARRDVIGNLAGTFNRMAGRIQRLLALQQELLAAVSHELRTPLQRMHFRLEAVREPGPDHEEQVRQLDRDIGEIGGLVDELLTYARLKEGNLDRVPGDLREVLSEVAASLRPAKVEIEVRNPETPLVAAVDQRLVSRAVSNLAANAVRHARTRVRLRAALEGGAVTIDVDDDGEGVPEADRERIFEPFQRLATPRTRGTAGFGLGLAIVRRVAERHGGSVHALAADLGGARFRLFLPQA